MPSSLIPWIMEKYGISDIGLRETEGTIWNGSGLIISPVNRDSAYTIARINWNISTLYLLTGRLKVDISFNNEALMGRSDIILTFNSLSIGSLKLGMPASTLAYIYKPAGLANPTGNITVTAEHLVLGPGSLTGKASLQWHDAGNRFSTVNPLGSYELLVTGNKEGKKAALSLKTVNGILNLSGSGYWDVEKTGLLSLSGYANPISKQDELEPLMRLLGRDLGGGKRRLSFSRTIRLFN